ncbi:IS5 family transposase [Massilia sp. 9096]|uniref:IS5 family transposase n=1 Tax=Massilia sp. 9096 TaxID=1500894 RepID=UPI0009DC963E|nr:IS5 family transposase [Massilia sp. 9096]
MSAPVKPKYRTTNWKQYNEALKRRGSLLIWLDPNMCWHGKPSGKRGRSKKYSEAAIQFCLTIKSLFNLALRQAMGMAQSLLKLAGLDWQVPDFSTVSRRQKHLAVTISAQPTTTGLHLLVDSTGIKMLGEGEWKTKKHGADYRRQWRKVHLGIDATTLEIRAIEVTDNATGDAPMMAGLLEQIDLGESIASVSGDGAYDTKGCHEAIARRGAHAIIPTRKNAKLWKDRRPGAEARNAIFHATRRLGRAIWKKWSGYHRRSLVETKMRCFKLLGERVMARDFDRQVAELQVRAAILNRFTHLGTPMTVAMP